MHVGGVIKALGTVASNNLRCFQHRPPGAALVSGAGSPWHTNHYRCNGAIGSGLLGMLFRVTEIPEERQAAELRALAEAGARRAELLAQAEEILNKEIRPHAVRAAKLGAGRNRIRELARVGPAVLYRWFEAEGLPVRDKRNKGSA